MSPLSQGRELKYGGEQRLLRRPGSPLSQGRELKYASPSYRTVKRVSPLSQGRELKFYENEASEVAESVAPLAGA